MRRFRFTGLLRGWLLHRGAQGFIPKFRRGDLICRERVRVYGRGHMNVGMAEPLAYRGKRNSQAEELRTV